MNIGLADPVPKPKMLYAIRRTALVFIEQGGSGFCVENSIALAGLVGFNLPAIPLIPRGLVTMKRNDRVNIARPERPVPIFWR